MATAARRVAYRVLRDVEAGGTTLADRLAQRDARDLPARDRALAHELVLGTLRRRGALDFALAPLLQRQTIGRLDPAVRAILRLGAHQVLHLRVPDRAAVSESVDLARGVAPRAAGLVNAVLRRLAREGPLAPPDPETDALGWLTTAGSLPTWLAQRWVRRLGPAAAVARARAWLAPPPAVFRLNPRVKDALDQARAAGVGPVALTVPGAWLATGGDPYALAARNVVYMQDQGSQMVGRLAEGGRRTLDACAAPGGKSMLLADANGPASTVIAAEASPRRAETLAALVRGWGAPGVHVVAADGVRPPLRGTFDTVLIDAPCSGLGTLARHPDIRWRAKPADLPRHAARQGALLRSLAPLVRPGGTLVFATCSPEPEENEGVVEPFLASHVDFALARGPGWADALSDGPFYRTLPERDGGDAFFAARLARR
ncbi:MAG TPA: transcription antitermination factor NusB [Vicinamibacteria bacterium]|nr:transcription antitermination factor NusB [Vicinamibacteria bacterium]